MRLTQKKIEEIIISIIGADGLPLAGQLYDKENVSEFDLANRTKKDIKVVRKMLYFLYNFNCNFLGCCYLCYNAFYGHKKMY